MAGSGAVDFHAQAGATEECVEEVSCRIGGATGIRRLRSVSVDAIEGAAGIHVARVFHTSHLRVGVGESAAFFRRADVVLGADAGPVRSLRADAFALDVGGERRRVGPTELSELALVSLDGGGGGRLGGGVFLRGGGSVEVACADECDANCGDRECAECRFHDDVDLVCF